MSLVNAPSLKELRERPCSLEELQAALVKIIDLHNKREESIVNMIKSGRINSSSRAIENMEFNM